MSEKPTISTPNTDINNTSVKVMSPKMPKIPKIPKPNIKQVGVSPDSKKDPIKQAEQLKNKDEKKIAIKEAVLLSKNGQWSLNTDNEPHYHIHQDGHRLTTEPVSHNSIIRQYGSIQKLENAGYRLHLVDHPIKKKAPEGVDSDKHERCVMDVKEQGHNVGSAHAICSASMQKAFEELFALPETNKSEFGGPDEPVINYNPELAHQQEKEKQQKHQSEATRLAMRINHHIGARNMSHTEDKVIHHHREAEHFARQYHKHIGHDIDNKEYKKKYKSMSDKDIVKHWKKISYLHKTNNNQWSLEKKKPAFNPKQEQNTPGGQLRDQWVNWGNTTARNKIPKMEGAARTRALSKLAGTTEYRRNPSTNQIEFLMHRGMSTQELEGSHNSNKGQSQYPHRERNGWTPHKHVAHDFGLHGADDSMPGHVVSAWVPEDQLHSSMRQYGGNDPETQNMLREEDEWLVNHHTPLAHHEVTPANKALIKPLNKTEDLEKIDWKDVKNKFAGAAMAGVMTAGALGGASSAKAEMMPHSKLSQAYTAHAIDSGHEGVSAALSDIHANKLVPIVHHDSDTGTMKLSLHDKDSKREVMQFSDNVDGGYNMYTQKIGKDRFNTIKQHAQALHDHFVKFVNHVNSGNKAKTK